MHWQRVTNIRNISLGAENALKFLGFAERPRLGIVGKFLVPQVRI